VNPHRPTRSERPSSPSKSTCSGARVGPHHADARLLLLSGKKRPSCRDDIVQVTPNIEQDQRSTSIEPLPVSRRHR
jgi:hypothetical protein